MTAVIRMVNDEISKLYIAHTPQLSECRSTAHAATGSMTFVHRFRSPFAVIFSRPNGQRSIVTR